MGAMEVLSGVSSRKTPAEIIVTTPGATPVYPEDDDGQGRV